MRTASQPNPRPSRNSGTGFGHTPECTTANSAAVAYTARARRAPVRFNCHSTPNPTASNPANPNNGGVTPVFLDWSNDLSAYAGQSVRIRWRFTSDGGAEFSGFWLDEVRIAGESVFVDPIFTDGFDDGALKFGRVIDGGDYVCH